MKNNNVSTKEAEKRAIQNLIEMDGYFADALSVEERAIIFQNIDDDFELFCGTHLDSSVEIDQLNDNLKHAKMQRDEYQEYIAKLESRVIGLEKRLDEYRRALYDEVIVDARANLECGRSLIGYQSEAVLYYLDK